MSPRFELIGPMRARREAFLKEIALAQSYIDALDGQDRFADTLSSLPQLPDLLFNYVRIMMDRVSAIEADLEDLGFDPFKNEPADLREAE